MENCVAGKFYFYNDHSWETSRCSEKKPYFCQTHSYTGDISTYMFFLCILKTMTKCIAFLPLSNNIISYSDQPCNSTKNACINRERGLTELLFEFIFTKYIHVYLPKI